METKTTRGLKVISRKDSTNAPISGAQESLFPLRTPRSVIFVSLPEVDHREFVSLLRNAAPALVVDLRRIPRFDIGPLNRQFIFDLFRQQGDVYLDFGTEHLEVSKDKNALSKIQKALNEGMVQQRPILFLTSAVQDLPSFSKSILEWLQESSEPWEIYQVPQHGAKSLAEFIA